MKTNALYHSDQGWGAYFDLPISGPIIRVTPFFALDTADDLVEEYSGLGVRFETRKLGTERLGASLEWSWFTQSWRNQTLAALALNPGLPGLYDDRTTFTPQATFAITRQLWIGGGVSIVELNPLDSPFSLVESRMANAAVGSLGYSLRHKDTSASHHDVDAVLTVRSGLSELESDYTYTRAVGQAEYGYRSGRHRVIVIGHGRHRSTATRPCSSGSRLATPGRCAAGTSTTSLPPAPTRWPTAPWSTGTGRSRSSWTPDLSGTRAPSARSACPPDSASTPVPLHDGRLPRQYRRPAGGLHDRLQARSRHERPEILTVDRRLSRPAALVVLTLFLWAALDAQAVTVNRVGDAMTVRAPGFTFIKGEPLARLKDGRSVRVDLELAILPKAGAPGVTQSRQTFVLSYDLWEERFAVTQVGGPARSAAYLTAAAAEAWCLEQVAVPMNAMGALGRDVPFWIRLEYRILDGDPAPAKDDAAGYTLQGLIDALSRRRKAQEWTHALEAGPFTHPAVAHARPRDRHEPTAHPADRRVSGRHRPAAWPRRCGSRTSLLDRSLGYATTGELDRAVPHARSDRASALSARA